MKFFPKEMPAFTDHTVEKVVSPEVQDLNDERWDLARRIAKSTLFAKSPRLGALLLYLCEQVLLDRATKLSEQNIASQVFDRKGKFDPGADTIVRSHMLRLRNRLEIYFKEIGVAEPIRISIPRGGYVPIFEPVQPRSPIPPVEAPSAAEPPVTHPEPPKTDSVVPSLRKIGWLFIIIHALLAFISISAIGFFFIKSKRTGNFHETATEHRLWSALFNEKAQTILVAADSGIVMLHGATGQNTNLSEYVLRDFSHELQAVPAQKRDEILFNASRRYTSFVDLEFFDRITHLSETVPRNYSIRFARDITVNDLKSSSAILSGSQDADPWIELFEPQMNFVLRDDLTHGIRSFWNRRPNPGELDTYNVVQYEYGVLAFLPNLSNMGNVLIVEGTSVAGTQAISDFLFSGNSLDSFLRTISKKDGSIPHFEVLLKSRPLQGSASRSQVLAFRTY